MDTENSYEKIVKLKSRYATALFTLSVFFTSIIILFNSSLSQVESEINRLEEKLTANGNYLGRYHCYKNKNEHYYAGLLTTSILNPFFNQEKGLDEKSITYSPIDGNISSWSSNDFFDSAKQEIEKLAPLIFKFDTIRNATKRLKTLIAASDTICKNDRLRNYFNKEILPEINQRISNRNWDENVIWIVYGIFPSYSGTPNVHFPNLSYTDRYYPFTDVLGEHYLYQLLKLNSDSTAEAILYSKWYNSIKEIENKSQENRSKVIIASIGVEVEIYQLLFIVAPILIFFQILFLLYWIKEQDILSKNDKIEKAYVFPDFGIIGYPKGKKYNDSFSLFFTGLIWTLFLLLPILILFLGFISRYDCYVLVNSFQYRSVLHRSTDLISVFIDSINLIILSISLFIVLYITKASIYSTPIKTQVNKRSLFIISCIVVFITSIVTLYFKFSFFFILYIIQLFTCFYFLYLSSLNHSVFLINVIKFILFINMTAFIFSNLL